MCLFFIVVLQIKNIFKYLLQLFFSFSLFVFLTSQCYNLHFHFLNFDLETAMLLLYYLCIFFNRYVGDVTKVSWQLVNHNPPFELDTEFQTPVRLSSDRHQRHHSSDRTSDTVTAFLWPALLLRNTCVQKAVVVTGVA